MLKNKIIVILGPTSSGKSELAIKMARKIGGEVISADSRQVYKELNIGSGKISKKEMKGVPHHCLDVASPKKIYTAIDFKKCAGKAIKDILVRKKTPIVCGGTGFYINAITGGIDIPEVKPDWKLRKKLEKKSVGELFKILKKLDPTRAKNIDAKNPRRLVRAIEIAMAKPSAISHQPSEAESRKLKAESYFFIGIKLPEKELKKRIEKRVKKMIKDGLINEVKKLKKQGLSWKRLYGLGFEYRYPAMLLQGQITKDDMMRKLITENWQYAKRQMTWFKKYFPKTKWIRGYKPVRPWRRIAPHL